MSMSLLNGGDQIREVFHEARVIAQDILKELDSLLLYFPWESLKKIKLKQALGLTLLKIQKDGRTIEVSLVRPKYLRTDCASQAHWVTEVILYAR